MWADPLRRVRPGERVRPSASRENATIEAAQLARRSRNFGSSEEPELGEVQVLIQATTDLTQFGPFALGDILTTPGTPADPTATPPVVDATPQATDQFQTLPAFKNAPCLADQPFGIMLEPAKTGTIGRGILYGLAPANVNVLDAGHKYVRVNSDGKLESCPASPVPLVWGASAPTSFPAQQWCLIVIGPQMRGFPWGADHPWGLISVNGVDQYGTPTSNVVIAPGEFQAGNGQPLATLQSAFAIAADASYIGLQYDPGAGILSLIGPTTDKPIPGGGSFRVWLYLFSFDGTKATYVKHNLTGNWHAAMYAFNPTETLPNV